MLMPYAVLHEAEPNFPRQVARATADVLECDAVQLLIYVCMMMMCLMYRILGLLHAEGYAREDGRHALV